MIKTITFTIFALLAFAANSVLCRLALGEQAIDAGGFTIVRLLSGAIILYLMIKLKGRNTTHTTGGSRLGALMLFLYAITFSYAYISLDTGTGALILFAAVQITMIILSMFSGYRLLAAEWVGIAIAFLGFIYLILPGVSMPSPLGLVLMTLSGSAWGVYTMIGRKSENPLQDTAYNFYRTIPLLILTAVITFGFAQYTARGIILAILSGAIASGIGYAIWYTALGGLSDTTAGVVQLLVPLIAAWGGVIFVGESVTLRLLVSALMILGGVLVVILGKYYLQRIADKKG